MQEKKKIVEKNPVKNGDEIEADIIDLAYGGEGVAKYQGYTIFVREGLPGDRAVIKIKEAKKNYARGIIKKIIKDSEMFINPVCPHFKECGGCQWLHMKYEDQLKYKIKFITHNMETLAKIQDAPYGKIIRGRSSLYYRNRMQYKLAFKNGRIITGFYEEDSHNVVNIHKCFIANEKINEAANIITGTLNDIKKEIALYDEEKHSGYLRQLAIRANQRNELLVTFVVAGHEVKKFINYTARVIAGKMPEIKGVTVNFNTKPGNRVFGDREQVVFGEKYLAEKVKDIRFRLGSDTFFQVNTKRLFDMLEFVDRHTKKGAKVLDLYGGIGALSLPFYGKFSSISVVEVNSASVNLLNEILADNNVSNTKAILADAQTSTGLILKEQNPDTIIVDPPRKGIHEAALLAIKKSNAKTLVYISCNPVTFARDMAFLKEEFEAVEITPADLFPNTYHVEILACLKRKTKR